MLRSLPPADPSHGEFLNFATKRTTPVVIYVPGPGGSRPVQRGTAFLLAHGERVYAVTNTHVLECYAAARKAGKHAVVQIWSGEGEPGTEFHGGYLLMPNNITTTVLGVTSRYAHRDVGLIELTTSAVTALRRGKEFLCFDDLVTALPDTDALVYYKGYPSKSAEFHGTIQSSYFGQWLDVRRVAQVTSELIVTGSAVAVYRSSDFPKEDGKDLEGISGSALIGVDNRVVGVVWGGEDRSVDSPLWAVPSKTVRELVLEYERRCPRRAP